MSPPAAGLGPLRRTVRETGLALITLGVVILLFVAYQLFGTNLTEARNQAQLKKSFERALLSGRPAPAPATVPSTTAPPTPSDSPVVPLPSAPSAVAAAAGGSAIDHMVIPKIGLDKFVVEGTAEDDLTRGPGHYTGTPYPGQLGNVGIAGHRTTYGAPFYRLDQLGVGDDIYFTDTTGAHYRYQVDQPAIVVSPSDVAVLDPTADAELTLTTCNPRFSATSRLVVKAKLVGLPAPAPAVTPAQVVTPTRPAGATAKGSGGRAAPTANLTGGNRSAWPPALGYGGAVILLWIGTRLAINRTRRLARAGAFVGGVGVCCLPLWLCFENVVRLLPQSI